ncbi:MAG: hypothetical protein JOZ07_06545 [Solirubrobacterales bacterium]|nr:hypothetical protein [Solirubrobacterales bacterium]
MFTAAGELTTDPAGTLNALRQLGVDRVHIYMHWADMAPDPKSPHRPAFDATDPGGYPAAGWAPYDAVVRGARARGMGLDVALVPPPPRWAEGAGAPDPSTQTFWKPSASQFGQWVEAAAKRYSGHFTPPGDTSPLPRVTFWSLYNEPNLGFQLAPQSLQHSTVDVSTMMYRQLVDAGWSALQRTGHGHDTILIGELGPAGSTTGIGPGRFNSMAPLRFLRGLYCVGADDKPLRGAIASELQCPTTAAQSARFPAAHPGLFQASGVANHPYSQGLPPDQTTPNEPDFTELAATGKLESTLDTLLRTYGSHKRLPIWSTEFGYQTTPPDHEAGTTSPGLAAYYINWAEYLTWLDPRQASFDQYQLHDGAAGIFATGLLTATGQPKPGYDAYRMPLFLPVTTTRPRHPLVVWGCVRPAPGAADTSHRPQTVAIQYQPASGGGFTTVQRVPLTGPHGYFEVRQIFPGSGSVRLAWRYPNGAQVFSRTQAITLQKS